MIRAVRCNQPEFKPVTFETGFNVIVAERTKEATRKDSRNGLGKTTIIEIIHFCLGANATKGKGLRVKPLSGWVFYLDIELRGRLYTIQRNTDKPGRVIVDGDWSDWPIEPQFDPSIKKSSLSIKEWRTILGWLVFDLPPDDKDQKYQPTFRSLISYFIRKGRDAFTIPFEHYRKQLEWDKQVNNAFLLGLGWEYAQRGQFLKDKDKAVKQLKSVATSGLMPNLVGSIGELEATKISLEEQLSRSQEQLDTIFLRK